MQAFVVCIVNIFPRSRGVVASACAFLVYMGAHQVENIYKDELYNSVVHVHAILTFPDRVTR